MKWSGPKLPPGVSATPKPLSDGSVRWHFYHKATQTKLLNEPGTSAFEAEVLRAANPKPVPLDLKPETLADICDKFEKSPEHRRCEPSTRLTRERVLIKVRARWGEYQSRHLSDRRFRGEIIDWRDTMSATPNMADKSVQTLQRLLSWAYDRGKIEYDHSKKIERLSPKRPRAGRTITPAQESILLACGSPARVRFYLLARLTGMRESDLCRLKWTDIGEDGWIEWQHSKTKKSTQAVSFYPTFALPELKRLLDTAPKTCEYILTTDRGIRLTSKNLKRHWADWRLKAGLADADIHFHDTRHRCVQDLLNAGCTNAEAASISGHKISGENDGSFELYAKRSRHLALAAYKKLASAKPPEPTDSNVVLFRR